MGLKAKLAKPDFDKLDEAIKALYKQSGDDYLLDAEGVEDVSGLKSALQKERDAKAQFERDLKAERDKFNGVDPVKYAEFMTAAENKETEDLKKKGQIDEIINKHNEKFAAQRAQYEAQLKAKDDELDKIIVDNGLRKVFESGGVLPDRIEDAVQLIKSRAKRNEKGDLIILDEDGLTPLDASPEMFAKELFKEKKPWLYAGTGAGGSGAQNGTNGAGVGQKTKPRSEWDKMSSAERTTFTNSGGTFVDA